MPAVAYSETTTAETAYIITVTVTSFCFPKKKNEGLSDASNVRMGWMMFIASKTG
jgi:hypothetical protein